MTTLPGLPPSRAERDEQRKAAGALLAVQAASTVALCDSDVAEMLMMGLCAHALETGNTSLGPETKRKLIEGLLEDRWSVAVKAWEASK